MDDAPKKSGWKIFIYLIPVYILAAIPLVKWTLKNQSSDMNLSKEEYSAFNSSEGEIKKTNSSQYRPDLNDIGYTLHYRSGGSKTGTQEELDWGYRQGYLLEAVGRNINNPKAIDELFSNQWAVKGFLGRASVKKALASAESLREFLEDTSAANAFLADRTVNAALNSPRVLDILTQSDLAKTLLAAPAVQSLIKNPGAVEDLLENNPKFVALLHRPGIKTAIMTNPQTNALAAALGWK